MTTFIERVHALPAELYNEIRDYTFNIAFGTIHIDAAYRPPAIILVNRSTRSKLAEAYYGNTSIFYVDKEIIRSWLKSIDPEYVQMLKEVRIFDNRIRICRQTTPYQLLQKLCQEYDKLYHLSQGAAEHVSFLRFEVYYSDPEKAKWVSLHRLARESLGPSSLLSARAWVEVYGTE